jgi:hypothetical protein
MPDERLPPALAGWASLEAETNLVATGQVGG